jgi:hypothetical protein
MAYEYTTHLQVPQCDVFQVEDLVEEHYALQLSTKEQRHILASQRQDELAGELSDLAVLQHQDDILTCMLESEVSSQSIGGVVLLTRLGPNPTRCCLD